MPSRERPVSRIVRLCAEHVQEHPELLEGPRQQLITALLKVVMTGRDNPATVQSIIEYDHPPCW